MVDHEKTNKEYKEILRRNRGDKAAAYAYIDRMTDDAAEQAIAEEEYNKLEELQNLRDLAETDIIVEYMMNAGYAFDSRHFTKIE